MTDKFGRRLFLGVVGAVALLVAWPDSRAGAEKRPGADLSSDPQSLADVEHSLPLPEEMAALKEAQCAAGADLSSDPALADIQQSMPLPEELAALAEGEECTEGWYWLGDSYAGTWGQEFFDECYLFDTYVSFWVYVWPDCSYVTYSYCYDNLVIIFPRDECFWYPPFPPC